MPGSPPAVGAASYFEDAHGAVKLQGVGGACVLQPADPIDRHHYSDDPDDGDELQPGKARVTAEFRKMIERERVRRNRGKRGAKGNDGAQDG